MQTFTPPQRKRRPPSPFLPEPPQSLEELEQRFSDPQACLDYIAALKYRNGFFCPRCRNMHWLAAAGRKECAACGYQASVTVDTLFQKTHTPLPVWLRVIRSLLSLTTPLPLREYRKWMDAPNLEPVRGMLAKLRMGLEDPFEGKLQGLVTLDSHRLDVLDHRGRPHEVFLAAEIRQGEIQAIRWKRHAGVAALPIQFFLEEAVEREGSALLTRSWQVHQVGQRLGYPCLPLEHEDASTPPVIGRVLGDLKQRLAGVQRLSEAELDLILELHAFQHKNRHLGPGALFEKFMLQAVRSLEGRKWPPPPMIPISIASRFKVGEPTGLVRTPEEVLSIHEARLSAMMTKKRFLTWYKKTFSPSPAMLAFINQGFLSQDPRNVRRRAKRAAEGLRNGKPVKWRGNCGHRCMMQPHLWGGVVLDKGRKTRQEREKVKEQVVSGVPESEPATRSGSASFPGGGA